MAGTSAIACTHTRVVFQHKASWGFGKKWLPGTQSLAKILNLYENCQASDIRDKIYGLLGLVNAETTISVEYSNSVEELYFRVVKKVYQTELIASEVELRRFHQNLRRTLMLPGHMDFRTEEFVQGSVSELRTWNAKAKIPRYLQSCPRREDREDREDRPSPDRRDPQMSLSFQRKLENIRRQGDRLSSASPKNARR
jgi:hypothetical protein